MGLEVAEAGPVEPLVEVHFGHGDRAPLGGLRNRLALCFSGDSMASMSKSMSRSGPVRNVPDLCRLIPLVTSVVRLPEPLLPDPADS